MEPASPIAPAANLPPPSSPVKKWLTTLAKTLVVVGLLWFLSEKGLLSWKATAAALSTPVNLLVGVLLSFTTLLLAALRWRLLLKAQGIHLSVLRTVQLAFVGMFFNIALPGSVTGDLVKGYYVGREASGRGAHAFGSILFDRVLGVSGLVLLSAITLCFDIPGTAGNAGFEAMAWTVRVLGACIFAFYVYLFVVNPARDPMLAVAKWVEARVPRVEPLRKVYEGLMWYHHHASVVAICMGFSLMIHTLVGAAFYFYAGAVGEHWITMKMIYAVFAAGLVVTTVPVGPAGVGTGHAAFAYLFGLVGSQRGADIFTLFVLAQMLVGGVGGLVYLRFKSAEPPAASGTEPRR